MCDPHRFGRRLDERHHVIRVGDHRHVVRRDFDGGGVHAGGELVLGILLTSGAVQGVAHCLPEPARQHQWPPT